MGTGSQLREFLGAFNSFSGQLPDVIPTTSFLDSLDLAFNNLTGLSAILLWCLHTLASWLNTGQLNNPCLACPIDVSCLLKCGGLRSCTTRLARNMCLTLSHGERKSGLDQQKLVGLLVAPAKKWLLCCTLITQSSNTYCRDCSLELLISSAKMFSKVSNKGAKALWHSLCRRTDRLL
jgi:hypothetical protein